jgi:hypothetical protein
MRAVGRGARQLALQTLLHEHAERIVTIAAERPAAREAGRLVQADRRELLDPGLEAQRADASAHRRLDRIEDRAPDAAAARVRRHEHALDLGATVAVQLKRAAADRHAVGARHEQDDVRALVGAEVEPVAAFRRIQAGHHSARLPQQRLDVGPHGPLHRDFDTTRHSSGPPAYA